MVMVNSSNLYAVDYNPSTETLTIQFRSGRVYEYYNVPLTIYEGLLNAPSKGKFHHEYIKYSYYYNRIQWSKLTGFSKSKANFKFLNKKR